MPKSACFYFERHNFPMNGSKIIYLSSRTPNGSVPVIKTRVRVNTFKGYINEIGAKVRKANQEKRSKLFWSV